MTRRVISALLLFVLVLALKPLGFQGALSFSASAAGEFAIPEFSDLWQRTDGPVATGAVRRSWLWGPSPGESQMERIGPDGELRQVQYFDKARMELNTNAPDGSAWRVTTGLLVAEMVGLSGGRGGQPARVVLAGDDVEGNPRYSDFAGLVRTSSADRTGQIVDAVWGILTASAQLPRVEYAHFSAETGHNIPAVFWDYLTGPLSQSLSAVARDQDPANWLYVMGYPISEPVWADIRVGGTTQLALIQLFQRRVLTYVPDFPPGWQVQMGNAGSHYLRWRGTGEGGGSGRPSPSLPTPLPATGGFVGVRGRDLIFRETRVALKGTNYWLSEAPFADTWAEWNGPRAQKELGHARELGVNAVRIGIPYDNEETFDVVWGGDTTMSAISPWIQSQVTQLLQLASANGMKVIIVLFDWYDGHPPVGTLEYRQNLAYLDGLVAHFRNDDRVLAWEIRNEPDFYDEWKAGRHSEVIEWTHNIAAQVRALDPRHPITLGTGDYRSLWATSEKGTTLLDIADIVSLHCYDPGVLREQIQALKARTTKPILLAETGWPTSTGGEPPVAGATFDEATQSYLYREVLKISLEEGIAGVIQWTLFDFSPAKAHLVQGFERYFGLYRLDGSAKPAAAIFRADLAAPLLFSDTRTDQPLDTSDRPFTRP